MSWLTSRLPARTGLASERGANSSGLLVAWLFGGIFPLQVRTIGPDPGLISFSSGHETMVTLSAVRR